VSARAGGTPGEKKGSRSSAREGTRQLRGCKEGRLLNCFKPYRPEVPFGLTRRLCFVNSTRKGPAEGGEKVQILPDLNVERRNGEESISTGYEKGKAKRRQETSDDWV